MLAVRRALKVTVAAFEPRRAGAGADRRAAIGITVLELAYRQWTEDDGPTFADAVQDFLGTVADVAASARAIRTG